MSIQSSGKPIEHFLVDDQFEFRHFILYIYIYIYIYLTDTTKKHLYKTQIQKCIANKKITQNFAQMKYKWPVTAIKPLKNKRFSVTSNPSTLNLLHVQYDSISFLVKSRLNQT